MATDEFTWLGNWLAINFVNTAEGARRGQSDLLPDAHACRRWLVEGGVASARSILLDTAEDRERCWSFALAYRALLRQGIAALATNKPLPKPLIPKTNMLLAELDNADRILEKNGNYRLVTAPKFQSPRTLMIPVARSFARLLVEADKKRLHKCRSSECEMYFYDTSKSGTRAWCSLEMCGNKSRLAAFRLKRAQKGP